MKETVYIVVIITLVSAVWWWFHRMEQVGQEKLRDAFRTPTVHEYVQRKAKQIKDDAEFERVLQNTWEQECGEGNVRKYWERGEAVFECEDYSKIEITD